MLSFGRIDFDSVFRTEYHMIFYCVLLFLVCSIVAYLSCLFDVVTRDKICSVGRCSTRFVFVRYAESTILTFMGLLDNPGPRVYIRPLGSPHYDQDRSSSCALLPGDSITQGRTTFFNNYLRE